MGEMNYKEAYVMALLYPEMKEYVKKKTEELEWINEQVKRKGHER